MKKTLVTLLLSAPLFLFSQLENNNWYFGNNAAVNFTNQAAPVALTNNQQSGPATGSISDLNGNLLFYTNGKQILTRQHQLMQNGDLRSENALGVAIAQHPGNSSWYYVFTMSKSHPIGNTPFLEYSIVDMSQGNLGADGLPLGAVRNDYKKVSLYTAYQDENIEPQFGIVKHADGKAFWLLTNDGNRIYSYLFDQQGLTNKFLSSFLNMVIPSVNYNSALKISPGVGQSKSFSNYVMYARWPNLETKVFSFNNETGYVTNDYELTITGQAPNIGEFTRDASILYVGRNYESRIFAFDLANSTNTAIYRQVYYNSNSSLRTNGMQISRYGDIYLDLNASGYLSKITNPNTFSSASVDLNNLYLGGKTGWKYLPNSVITFRGCAGCKNGGEASGTRENSAIRQNLKENIKQQRVSLTVNLGESEAINTDISIHPNPVKDFLNIKTSAKIKEVEVYDMAGKKVKVEVNGNRLDVRQLPSGSYLVKITTETGMITKPFIK